MATLNQHLALQRNAFSTATTAPKICDGRLSSSTSERQCTSFTNSAADGKMLFMLQPNLINPIISLGTNGGPSSFTYHTISDFTTDSSPVVAATNNLAGADTTSTPNNILKVDSPDYPQRFRLVSAGMRITPINNSESNNGWFEAIRVPASYAFENLDVSLVTGTPATAGFVTLSISSFGDGIALDNTNWCNFPGYVAGKLRDIQKHMFYLQASDEHEVHEFPDRPTVYSYFPSRLSGTPSKFFPLANVTSGQINIDKTFDVVLVRVRTTEVENENVASLVHVHTVHNWELVYGSKTSRSKTHTACIPAPNAVVAVDRQMKRDIKPSSIRLPSKYGYSAQY